VEKLDGLPLALATAGAYLCQNSRSFSQYLHMYETSWLKLHNTAPWLRTYDDRTLCTTWQLSLDQIMQQNKLSARLLKLWAYFDNEDIWFELLQHGRLSNIGWMSELVEDEFSFDQTMRVLCNYGLAEVAESLQELVESRGYSMHSCVHLWTIHVLNQEWDYEMANLALTCVGSHVPNEDALKFWVTQRRLLGHTARCWDLVSHGVVRDEGLEWALGSLANLYCRQCKLDEAEKMYVRALLGFEKALGADHTSTLETANNLGLLYADQGKLEEAEKIYVRALQGFEKALGADHTSTLGTVNNLGLLYAGQGKLEEAEKMYVRALQGYKKALGPELFRTNIPALNTTENLAYLYRRVGRTDEAREMFSHALRGLETVLGASNRRCEEITTALAALEVE
jgi:tetratricopeptide (TPR) repeat protein